jgi:hypothetical protein
VIVSELSGSAGGRAVAPTVAGSAGMASPGRGLPLLWRTQAARNIVGTATMPSTTMAGLGHSSRTKVPPVSAAPDRNSASRQGVPLVSEIWKVGIIDGTSVSQPICAQDLNEDDESGR